MHAGERLRILREQLGLTLRDVEAASNRLAEKYDNAEYSITLSRLSDIETKGVVPSIFRIYAIAVIYRRDLRELLSWYGIDWQAAAADSATAHISRTHRVGSVAPRHVRVPVKMDPAFQLSTTTNIGRMVEQWGTVPMTFLERLEGSDYSYGYIGTEDLTMYPLLMPGSFVQIDETRTRVVDSVWRSEYERPVYFVETRDGFACSWCAMDGDKLILQPAPLSPQKVRIFRHPQEAEVLGQVVAVAMRLGEWRLASQPPRGKPLPAPI